MKPVILGVIPARKGSKRLPGKNMMEFCGFPLIDWTTQTVTQAHTISDWLISTDCPTIREREGCGAPFLRPARLATARASSWAVLRHAVKWWERFNRQTIDYAVLLQPTSPLRTGKDIDGCVRMLQKHDRYDMAVSVSKLNLLPNGAVYVVRRACIHHVPTPCAVLDYEMPASRSIDIDTLAEFKAAEAVMRRRLKR